MYTNDPFDARKPRRISLGRKIAEFLFGGPGEVPNPEDLEVPTEESLSPSLEEMVGKRRFEQNQVKPIEQSLKEYEEATTPKPLDVTTRPKRTELEEQRAQEPFSTPEVNPTVDDEMLKGIDVLQPSEVEYHKPELSMDEYHGSLRTEGDNYRVLLHQIGPLVRNPRNADINTFQEILKDSRIPQEARATVQSILTPAKPTNVDEAEAEASLEDKARNHAVALLRHQYPGLTEVKARDIVDTGSGAKLQQKLRDYYRMQEATTFLKDQEASIVEDKKDAEEFFKIFPGKDDPTVQQELQNSLQRVQKGLAPRRYLDPAAEALKNKLYPFMKEVEDFDLGAASDAIEQSELNPQAKKELLDVLNVPVSPSEEEAAREQAIKHVERYYPDVMAEYPDYKKDFLESPRGDQFVKQIIDSNHLKNALGLLKGSTDPKVKQVLNSVLWSAEKGAMEPRGYGVQSETPSSKPKETNPLYNEPTSGESLRKRRDQREEEFKGTPEGQAEEAEEATKLLEALNPRGKKKEEEIRKEQELKDKRIQNIRGMLKEMEPYSLDPSKADVNAVSDMVNNADMPDYMKRILNRRLQPLDISKGAEYIFHPTSYRESMLKGLSDAETTMANAFDVKNTRTPKALSAAREFMNNPTPENQARAKQFLDLARIQDVMNIMNNWQLKWTNPSLMEFNKIKEVRPDIEPNQPGKPKFPFHAKPLMYRPADARNTSGLIDPYEMDQKKEKKRLNRKQTFENAGKEAYFETYKVPVKDRANYAEWFKGPEGKAYLTDVANTLEKDYQDRAAMYKNMPQRGKKVQELPTERSQLVDYVGKHFKSMEDLRGAARGQGTPEQQDLAKYILKKINPKELATFFTHSAKLNLKKLADSDGPGGADWSYEYTSGPSPTAMPKEKRKNRFPFNNSPGTVTPGEGDQGNMIDNKTQENYYLASIFPKKTKTADNDMFETYLWEGEQNRWVSQTVFKRAYQTFKPGDVVVQFGSSAHMYKTFRRRTGSIGAGRLLFRENLLTIADTLVGGPTPDDSLAEGPGGKIMRDVEQSKPGPRDGFERRKPSRPQTERNPLPYMDTPDSEGTGFEFLPATASIRKNAGALNIVNELADKWLETALAAGPDTVLDYFANDATDVFNDLTKTITTTYGVDPQSAVEIAKVIMQTVPEMIHVKFASKALIPGGHAPKPDADFDPDQLALGVKTELEHTSDHAIAKEIAKDHLNEMPDYYTKLMQMEKGGSLNLKKKAVSQTMVTLTDKGDAHYNELKQLWMTYGADRLSKKGQAALTILEYIFGQQKANSPYTDLIDVVSDVVSWQTSLGIDMAQLVQDLADNGYIQVVPVGQRGPEGEPIIPGNTPETMASLHLSKKLAAKVNMYAKSILNQILEPMRTATEETFPALQQLALDTISQSQIDENDKAKMLATITQQTSLQGLQKYLFNALLAFEGLGVLSSLRLANFDAPPHVYEDLVKTFQAGGLTRQQFNDIIAYYNLQPTYAAKTAEQMVTQSQTPEDQAWQEQPGQNAINYEMPAKRKRPNEYNETQLYNGEYGDRPRMQLSKKRKKDSEK